MKDFSKWLIMLGLFAVAAGFLLNIFSDRLGWLGRLPGDLKFESKNVRFYFPFTSLILLNLLIYLIMRLSSWLK
jgi:hypothetical protein